MVGEYLGPNCGGSVGTVDVRSSGEVCGGEGKTSVRVKVLFTLLFFYLYRFLVCFPFLLFYGAPQV